MGEEEDQGDLDHFGNLEGEDSEVEPPVGASGADSQMGDPDQQQEKGGQDDARPGQLPEFVVGDSGCEHHDAETEADEEELFFKEELAVAEPFHRQNGAGTVDHHCSNGQQQKRGQ